MTIKKGDTLYKLATGEPVTVRRTRRLGTVLTRAYLSNGDDEDVKDGMDFRWYGRIQTPDLAQRWADTLRERERERKEREAREAQAQANRLAHRDLLNAPPTIGPLEIGEPDHHGHQSVTFDVTEYTENKQDGTAYPESRTLRVAVYNTHQHHIDTFGDWDFTPAAHVNWSALGSVSPAIARAYAQAILAAADLAEQMPLTPTED